MKCKYCGEEEDEYLGHVIPCKGVRKAMVNVGTPGHVDYGKQAGGESEPIKIEQHMELLPCPFCGGEPSHYLEPRRQGLGENFEYAVTRCKNNGCPARPISGSVMPKGEGLKSSARRWNIRA